MQTNISSAADRRSLRVGVLLGNHIVEERVLPAGRPVTLGTSARCTLVVPADGAEARWRLFDWRRGQCVLRWRPSMSGRLAIGEKVIALDRQGGHMVLPRAARGKVTLGELTVLFQMLATRPMARPRLPACIRGSALAGMDRVFAGFLALSLAGHLALVVSLRRVDWPRAPDPERVADDFKQFLVRRPPVVTPLPSQPQKRTAPGPAVTHRPKGPASVPKPVAEGERRAALVERVSKMGVLALLTAKGSDGAFADLLGKGGVERAQEQALAGVNGLQVASADPGFAVRPDTGQGRVASIHDIGNGLTRIATVDIRGRDERRVPSVQPDRPIIEEGSAGQVDASQLRREMKTRVGALRTCYERALKRDPGLGGKLLLRFTILPVGTVTSVELESDSLNDPDMTRCVRQSVAGWRFSAPEGGAVEVAFPFVFQPAGG
jgi:TonB family protein